MISYRGVCLLAFLVLSYRLIKRMDFKTTLANRSNKKPRILAGLVVYESSHILYEAHLKLSVLNHNFDGVAVNILNLIN